MAFNDDVPLADRTGEPFQELVKSLGGQLCAPPSHVTVHATLALIQLLSSPSPRLLSGE